MLSSEEVGVDPRLIGARECPRCGNGVGLTLEIKNIARRTAFATLQCPECLREAMSDVYGSDRPAIQEAIRRWNGIWPDVGGFLNADSEGVRYMTDVGGWR